MSDSEDVELISEKKATKNCNKFKDTLNKYDILWKHVEDYKIKIEIWNDLYLFINFMIPAFDEEEDILFETWHENSKGFINPLRDSLHTQHLFHSELDGFKYLISQEGLFKNLCVVQHYNKVFN